MMRNIAYTFFSSVIHEIKSFIAKVFSLIHETKFLIASGSVDPATNAIPILLKLS
jgi:hypothetical protein